MTKKHFKLAAELIAEETDFEIRNRMAKIFIVVARQTNSRFDTGRFLAACNL